MQTVMRSSLVWSHKDNGDPTELSECCPLQTGVVRYILQKTSFALRKWVRPQKREYPFFFFI